MSFGLRLGGPAPFHLDNSNVHPPEHEPAILSAVCRAPVQPCIVAPSSKVIVDPDTVPACGKPASPPEYVIVMLQSLIATAHFVRLHVELIGDGPKRELPAPVVFETALDAVSSTTSAAPLRLLYTDEVCEACAGAAVLTKEGLAFTPTAGPAAAWSPGPIDARGDLDRLPGVELRWTGDVEALARASVIALAHAHLLTVRVPAPDPMPVVRER